LRQGKDTERHGACQQEHDFECKFYLHRLKVMPPFRTEVYSSAAESFALKIKALNPIPKTAPIGS